MKITNIKTQKGGLLVEALAILGIVAVTSPMIYKKKIDKAQELEDIAKASQMKIIKDAVANYVDAKYNDYVLADGEESAKTKIIGLSDISDFLPPGFDEDKTIKIGIRSEKINGTDRVSAIVVDSEKFNEKRGNRVASLIGADGGYAGLDGTAVGNNSVWSVDPTKFGFAAGEVKSQLVSTTQFSKSAASGEYLYKYKVEGQPQVNMMMTNINMRGNDLNNTSSVGLMYGRDDKFTSWRLNGNKGEQYGDGTIVGKNTSGFDTVALQANRAGKTVLSGAGKDLALVNGEVAGKEKEDPKVDGSGALTLRAMKNDKTTGGCTEALASSDIGVGDGAGIFTACNNNASRTAYLIANGENNGGELRVRKDGNQDAGATAYSDATDKGSAFTVTDGDGKVTGVIASNKSNSVNLFFKNDAKTEDNSAMELMTPDGNSKVIAVANSDGGSVALKDADDQETVRMIGEEATVVATTKTNGKIAAGITGKNEKENDVHGGYSGDQLVYNSVVSGRLTSDEKNPALTGGALFVRGDADKTGVLVSGTSKTAKSGILTMGDTDNRNVLISSEKGSSMSLANSGVAKVTVEGDRKSGAVSGVSSTALSKSGYFEVVGNGDVNNPIARSEVYASLSGKLARDASEATASGFDGGLGTFYGSGTVADDKNGGGSYLAYNNNTGTVKLMASGAYDGVAENGGTIELTPADTGKDKAVITTAMKSELGGSNVGAAARLSAGDGQFAHFGANSVDNAGEMVLKSKSGSIEALGSQNSGGSMYFKRGAKPIDGVNNNKEINGVVMTAAGNSDGNVKVYDESGAKVEITGTEARVMNNNGEENTVATAILGDGGLSLRNATGREKTGVEFSSGNEGLQFYDPDGKKAVFAAGDTFQTGQSSEVTMSVGGNDLSLIRNNSSEQLLGAILVRSGDEESVKALKITAPMLKTDLNVQFNDICIQGNTNKTGENAACLSDAAVAAGMNSLYKDLSKNGTDGRNNFGRAVWQLIAPWAIDLWDSNQHNDTHHLAKAWNGADGFKVSGTNIGYGSAVIKGNKYDIDGTHMTYINQDGTFNYISKDKTGADNDNASENGGIRAQESFEVSYKNIEYGDEVVKIGGEGKAVYRKHNLYTKEAEQYSAAGHQHGVAELGQHKNKWGRVIGQGHMPVVKEKSWRYTVEETAEEAIVPNNERKYVAAGHYHLNYDENYSAAMCGKTYKVRSIKKNCVGSGCVKTETRVIDCGKNLSGAGDPEFGNSFYQGFGTESTSDMRKPANTKWNKDGTDMGVLDGPDPYY